ncbi:MAG: hypothetical protein M1282_11035 [Chloroflexi bacterium]|nr:hypothetical protein [Chloroflexota bacterium]
MKDIPECELRGKRIAHDRSGEHTEYFCMAADGALLASSENDLTRMKKICGSCPLPNVLAHDPKACLYLRPIRFLEENKTYFACRTFYKLLLGNEPQDMDFCHACPYWFPRPPLELIRGHAEDTHMIRLSIISPPERSLFSTPVKHLPRKTLFRRMAEWFSRQHTT